MAALTDLKNLIVSKIVPKTSITIDYPKNGETILSNYYAVRISATGGNRIQIAIDKSSWLDCRYANGFYWHDWHSVPKGFHKILARMELPNGKFKQSKIVNIYA